MLISQISIQRSLVVFYLLVSYHEIQAEIKPPKSDLEKQLKALNKPVDKAIKTRYGETYDCVDFYKQPAFDHPMLKNHNFHPEMKPSLSRINRTSGTSKASRWNIWLKGKGCPFGTVPIKRITEEDLIRQKSMPPPEDDITFTGNRNHSELKRRHLSELGYMNAIVTTVDDENNKFGGAGMQVSVWRPHVKGQQYSGCRLKLQKGPDIIQVGWRVDPTLYGDNLTRLFIHFQAGDTQCFKTLCPGFIIVNHDLPLDVVLWPTSRRGKDIRGFSIYLAQEFNGNWWLLISLFEDYYKQIGFWPRYVFTDTSSFASKVSWGGVAYSPPDVLKPPMGNSAFPLRIQIYDSFCRKIEVSNVEGETINVKTTSYTDDDHLYQIIDESPHVFYYGGPAESIS